MKTIEPPITTWNFAFTCQNCGAKLEADENDLEWTKIDIGGAFTDCECLVGVFALSCPHCNQRVWSRNPRYWVDAPVLPFIPQKIKDAVVLRSQSKEEVK